MFPVDDKIIVERLERNGEEVWRVCGLGYCTEHRQRWQAEVLLECLLVAKGLSTQSGCK
jgi:hypothetical protein